MRGQGPTFRDKPTRGQGQECLRPKSRAKDTIFLNDGHSSKKFVLQKIIIQKIKKGFSQNSLNFSQGFTRSPKKFRLILFG